MHKDIPVVDIVINDDRGHILDIGVIHNIEHLPIGTAGTSGKNKGKPDDSLLDNWWMGRSIPASRDNLQLTLELCNIDSPTALLSKCYGLSLSDHYWVCPKGSGLTWSNINFFENDFSEDVGESLLGRRPEDPSLINIISPDITSDGWLRKKWTIINGKRVLMKGGSAPFEQEPFNEVIATAIMRRLNISHIPYTLTFDGGKPYSLCNNFLTVETELIPAKRVKDILMKSNNDSMLMHLLRCCDNLGMPDVSSAIDKMLTLDYIIANTDRHYNNFGFIRNSDSLQWIGFAPIYDSGTSLGHNALTHNISKNNKSKPFKDTHKDQIKLVKDFNWFNIENLRDITIECKAILERADSDLIDEQRQEIIAKFVMERAERISRIQNQHLITNVAISTF